MTVNFENKNDFPFIQTLDPDPVADVNEDGDNIVFTATPIDYDQNDNLTIGYVMSNSSLFESITIDPVEGASGEIRTFTFDPADNQYGSSTLIITITDGTFTTTPFTKKCLWLTNCLAAGLVGAKPNL